MMDMVSQNPEMVSIGIAVVVLLLMIIWFHDVVIVPECGLDSLGRG